MNNVTPYISIIIPVFNASAFIENRLKRVFSQRIDKDFDVLLIDDCSTDDTFDILSRFAQNEPRIRLFQQECNQGPASARNRGIKESKGKYIAFLDADDYWQPGFLEKTSPKSISFLPAMYR